MLGLGDPGWRTRATIHEGSSWHPSQARDKYLTFINLGGDLLGNSLFSNRSRGEDWRELNGPVHCPFRDSPLCGGNGEAEVVVNRDPQQRLRSAIARKKVGRKEERKDDG